MKNIPPGVGSAESVGCPPSSAFGASNASPLLQKQDAGVTVDDVLDVFSDARVVSWPLPIPTGHQALLDAARAVGFPWLRLRTGLVIAGDEDGWRACLEGFVSPADLGLARRLLAGGYGLGTRAGLGDAPPWRAGAWRTELAVAFTSNLAQVCATCGGRCWRRTRDGDLCASCHPEGR